MLSSSKISAPFIHIRIDPVLSPRGSSSISKKFHLPTGTGVAFVYSALGAMFARLVGLYVSLSVLPVGLKPTLTNRSDTAWVAEDCTLNQPQRWCMPTVPNLTGSGK